MRDEPRTCSEFEHHLQHHDDGFKKVMSQDMHIQMQGLRAGGFNIDAEDYWDFIRDGAKDFLFPHPDVRSSMCSSEFP
jgi:hypothetical protein